MIFFAGQGFAESAPFLKLSDEGPIAEGCGFHPLKLFPEPKKVSISAHDFVVYDGCVYLDCTPHDTNVPNM